MAFVKYCDNSKCAKRVGEDIDKPFVQVRQSRSDQREGSSGEVLFRYLTEYGDKDTMMTFCDDKCEQEWKDEKRLVKGWIRK